MKTFSLAFILGVFVGALVTAYFGSPNSYQNLLAAKAELLGEEALREETLASPDPEEPAPEPTAPAEQNPPAQVPVQPEPLPEPPSDAPPEAPPAEQPAPAPADDPQPEEPQSEPTPDPVPSPQPEDVPEASPQPTPDQPSEPDPDLETLTEKARHAIGSGAEKAAELAETAKEKSATLREDAEPYLERGVDIGIAATIRAQFKLDRRIDSDAIAIDVKNRAVHLTGKVPTSKIKQLVIETAMGTKGVSQVTEELSVEP